jgi:hypothetical protein
MEVRKSSKPLLISFLLFMNPEETQHRGSETRTTPKSQL